jgi:conjugative transposon TraN protein
MKKIILYVFILSALKSVGQSMIGCYPFSVTINKTSNLIFPFAIRSVDRGSKDILVQKAVGTENILQVKAAREHFALTSLAVITSDGKLYPFLISYDSMPAILNLSFVRGTGKPFVHFSDEVGDEQTLEKDAEEILVSSSFIYRRESDMKIELILKSIYFKDSLLWFHFRLANGSAVPFAPGHIHFFICDRSQSKRTAKQQIELTVMHISSLEILKGKEHEDFAGAFNPFSLNSHQELTLQLGDPAGGRTPQLHIPAKLLLKARSLQ